VSDKCPPLPQRVTGKQLSGLSSPAGLPMCVFETPDSLLPHGLPRTRGNQVTVDTLDERTLAVDICDVVSPSYTKIVRGEGMPKTKAPGEVCLSPPL